MLQHLIQILETCENGLNVAEISRELGAQPSAVFGMIQTLLHKQRLVEIGPDGKYCTACSEKGQCNLLAARGARYALRAPQQEEVE